MYYMFMYSVVTQFVKLPLQVMFVYGLITNWTLAPFLVSLINVSRERDYIACIVTIIMGTKLM